MTAYSEVMALVMAYGRAVSADIQALTDETGKARTEALQAVCAAVLELTGTEVAS